MAKYQTIDAYGVGDVTVVTFLVEQILDAQIIQKMREELGAVVGGGYQRKFLLNFANVVSLSSAALNVFIILDKRIRTCGGRLAVCNVDPVIHFEFSCIRFPSSDDRDDFGGVLSRLKPKPSGRHSRAQRTPDPNSD